MAYTTIGRSQNINVPTLKLIVDSPKNKIKPYTPGEIWITKEVIFFDGKFGSLLHKILNRQYTFSSVQSKQISEIKQSIQTKINNYYYGGANV